MGQEICIIKPSTVWGGRRWWLNGGYYCNRRGKLLHRAIFRSVYGPIPDGMEIHHKDENKTNNAIENLQMLTATAHRKLHALQRPKGYVAWTREQRVISKRAQWAAREPHEIICANCGQVCITRGERTKYCSGTCRSRQYRKEMRYTKEMQCGYCGKVFLGQIHDCPIYCSRSCKSSACNVGRVYARRRGPRSCAVCGTYFRVDDPRTLTCSRKCGVTYRSAKRCGTVCSERQTGTASTACLQL